MTLSRVLSVLFLFIPVISFGQGNPDCFAEKDFLIIHSTRSYSSALEVARKAAVSLDMKLDLRGLIPDSISHLGLTLPVDTCLKYGQEYDVMDSTCYIARGRWDDGTYISIEYSNAYSSFSQGYFIVMACSGFRKDKEMAETLQKVKAEISDAYIKTSKVYMCCMH